MSLAFATISAIWGACMYRWPFKTMVTTMSVPVSMIAVVVKTLVIEDNPKER